MPKTNRNRQHQLGDIACDKIRGFIREHTNWTVDEPKSDYGEDLFVRIFDNGQKTPLGFYIQSKGTENIDKYLIKNNKIISFPIDSDHLLKWIPLQEPLFLMIWCNSTKAIYWECIQINVTTSDIDFGTKLANQKTINVSIPIENVLNENTVFSLRAITYNRYLRLNDSQDEILALLDKIEDMWGVRIRQISNGFYSIPVGNFKASKPTVSETLVAGSLRRLIEKNLGAARYLLTPEQVATTSLLIMIDRAKATKTTKNIVDLEGVAMDEDELEKLRVFAMNIIRSASEGRTIDLYHFINGIIDNSFERLSLSTKLYSIVMRLISLFTRPNDSAEATEEG